MRGPCLLGPRSPLLKLLGYFPPDPCPLPFTLQFLLKDHHHGALGSPLQLVSVWVAPSWPGKAVWDGSCCSCLLGLVLHSWAQVGLTQSVKTAELSTLAQGIWQVQVRVMYYPF